MLPLRITFSCVHVATKIASMIRHTPLPTQHMRAKRVRRRRLNWYTYAPAATSRDLTLPHTRGVHDRAAVSAEPLAGDVPPAAAPAAPPMAGALGLSGIVARMSATAKPTLAPCDLRTKRTCTARGVPRERRHP